MTDAISYLPAPFNIMPDWILFFVIPICIGVFCFLFGFYLLLIRGVAFKSEANLCGRTAIVTGGCDGIGKEVVRDLVRRRARVIIGSRNKTKAFKIINEISAETCSTKLDYLYLDLADLDSVRQFAQAILKTEERLDILVNNAEIGDAPFERMTKQCFDHCFGVNHFGHFLLTNLLLPLLKKTTPSRIVVVSSFANLWVHSPLDFTPGGEKGVQYPNLKNYSKSKLANLMHAKALASRLQGTGVSVYTAIPGLVKTSTWDHANVTYGKWGRRILGGMLMWCSQSPHMGAQTIIYCAVEPSLQGTTGKVYFNCDETRNVFQSRFATEEATEKLWEVSCRATQSTTTIGM